jgi:hypothetical protein
MLSLAMTLVVSSGCAMQTVVSGFAPVYPEQTQSMQWGIGANPTDILDWVKVDSLQPTLRWKPFPGTTQAYLGAQIKPFVDVGQGSVSDVTYDLKIWMVSGDVPGALVYEREGIPEPTHHLESPLKPNTKYDWSVRARIKMDGKPRVTEWSLSQLPCPPAYGLECARGVARQTGTIPPLNYYRFQTPRQ